MPIGIGFGGLGKLGWAHVSPPENTETDDGLKLLINGTPLLLDGEQIYIEDEE